MILVEWSSVVTFSHSLFVKPAGVSEEETLNVAVANMSAASIYAKAAMITLTNYNLTLLICTHQLLKVVVFSVTIFNGNESIESSS